MRLSLARHLHSALLVALFALGCNQEASLTDSVFTLTVTGAGSVVSTPAGLGCSGPCTASFSARGGSAVTLHAVPADGFRFDGWSGPCVGTRDCTLLALGSQSVTAKFGPADANVAVELQGRGSGRVTSSPAGLDCPGACSAYFGRGTLVTLAATAAHGSFFTGWSGPCEGLGLCLLNVDEAAKVTATFGLSPVTLSLGVGAGGGYVSADKGHLSCPSLCSDEFGHGTEVTLTAQPAPGAIFVGWDSPSCPGTGPCKVTLDDSLAVNARFVYPLSVATVGGGDGTVTSAPVAIDCGAACRSTFDPGTSVTLRATPGPTSLFAGWAGACEGSADCVVTMDRAVEVSARFEPRYSTATVSLAGNGAGAVVSAPAGLECGPMCTATFRVGTAVTLTAAPAVGSRFVGWTGGCSGTGACAFTLGEPVEAVATFELLRYTVQVDRRGPGTVTSDVGNLYCGVVCSLVLEHGSRISFSATAEPGAVFNGWTGPCEGMASCSFVVDGPKVVLAQFSLRTYPLTVTRAGNGAGAIVSTPAGVDCGAACSAAYSHGAVVSLAAEPDARSTFTGWTGACAGRSACVVTMTEARAVTATFTANRYALTVEKAGGGSGVVQGGLGAIDCGSSCGGTFQAGAVVNLTVSPGDDSLFNGWSGACSGSGDCSVVMDGARSVTAVLVKKKHLLSVRRSGPGTVASTPSGIYCGTACDSVYDAGAIVVLVATPDSGSSFLGWNGACAGLSTTCQVTVDAARTAQASFGFGQYPVSVALGGSGSGSVISTPTGVSCGSECTAGFQFGSVVTLSAVPSEGSDFTGWTGACAGAGVCTLTVNLPQSVTANFTLRRYAVSVERAGGGSGVLRSSPAGIECGTSCAALFEAGSTLTVTPTPDGNSVFGGWSGACTGSGTCTFSVHGNTSLIGTFLPKKHLLTITRSGPGVVASVPTRLYCGSACQDSFEAGTVVTLTATPDTGATFGGWGGACAGTSTECTVTMATARNVTATFVPALYTLYAGVTGTGQGTVGSNPVGISCGGTCQATFEAPTVVTLSATPAEGSAFAGWSGACAGLGACTVTMSQARSAIARFVLLQYPLAIEKTGAGSGVVSSSPAGVSCGAACTAIYDAGTQVTLVATAAADSLFAGWSGACSGVGDCSVSMSAAKSATAAFTKRRYALSVVRTGPGTVVSAPSRIYCGSSCDDTFDAGTLITLVATPDAGAAFTGWSGACGGTALQCSFTLDGARTATARFVRLENTASVSLAGNGSGTVSSSPAGLACGSTCSAAFAADATVVLSATPSPGSYFAAWVGACSGAGVCVLPMTEARDVVAVFNKTRYVLAIERSGAGTGVVLASPGGADCAGACSVSYDAGTEVTLTAEAAVDSTFAGWAGVGCAGLGACVVTMDAAKAVSATFTKKSYTVGVTRTGPGLVVSTPSRLYCGSACVDTFEAGTSLTLTATPDAGATFTGWGGACSGTGLTCTVTIDTAKSISATFTGPDATLAVARTGSGSGTVTSAPAGIQCGASCSATYTPGTSVTLTATAATGSTFVGWTAPCTGTGTCTVNAVGRVDVTAIFLQGTSTLIVSRAGTGSGTVTSSPAGITCGGSCAAAFNASTSVTLTAAPDASSAFTGWSGVCSGSQLSCTVTVSGTMAATATFRRLSQDLSVELHGPGTVVSSPGGIYCGQGCLATFDAGADVILRAVPDAGASFREWGGACSGSGTCTVNLSTARSVVAYFGYAVTTSLVSASARFGGGSVSSSDEHIDCLGSGVGCSYVEDPGTALTLVATPAVDATFLGWTGDCAGAGTAACPLVMSAARTTSARFGYTLSTSVAGTGGGSISSSPAGISCGSDCSETYLYDTPVTLTATSDNTSDFSGWSGACEGLGSCVVTMSGAREVTATFTRRTHTLGVSRVGTGGGVVTSAPAGIDCGGEGACLATYDELTAVTLTASPDATSLFAGWSGVCGGTGACHVTLLTATSVTATFTRITYDLVVTPPTGGTVGSSPAGISCGATCSATYVVGTVVTLTPTPATGAVFAGWSGGCSGTGACVVSMGANTAVSAGFTYRLDVSRAGTGGGTVSSPSGISCGTTCALDASAGTSVTLTATPDGTSDFTGWSGGGCSGTGSCTVTMSAVRSVTATFTRRVFNLDVTVAGSGGSVTSSPAGIACTSGTCTGTFVAGTAVSLTATPGTGATFAGWSGDCSGTGACTVTMNAAHAVSATFSVPQQTLQLSFAGSGSVALSPGGGTCTSGSCSYGFAGGTVVTLVATPSSGWTFGIWSGCDSVSGNTCTVTMTQDRTIATGFNNNSFTLAASFQGSNGSITSNPAGINCGSVCSGSFTAGSTIRLIAVPESSAYYVSSWTGCTSFSGATCDVTMNANASVTAVFSPSPTGWVNGCEQPGSIRHFYASDTDDIAEAVNIGFSFTYAGSTYTSLYASTNAVLSFDTNDPSYSNTALPAGGGGRELYVFWDDLMTRTNHGFCTATVGNPGARQFVVTWSNMYFYGSTDNTSLTFSAILHEGTNAIDFIYYDMSSPQGTRGLGSSATIGIQWPGGFQQFGYNQNVITNGQTIHYDAP